MGLQDIVFQGACRRAGDFCESASARTGAPARDSSVGTFGKFTLGVGKNLRGSFYSTFGNVRVEVGDCVDLTGFIGELDNGK